MPPLILSSIVLLGVVSAFSPDSHVRGECTECYFSEGNLHLSAIPQSVLFNAGRNALTLPQIIALGDTACSRLLCRLHCAMLAHHQPESRYRSDTIDETEDNSESYFSRLKEFLKKGNSHSDSISENTDNLGYKRKSRRRKEQEKREKKRKGHHKGEVKGQQTTSRWDKFLQSIKKKTEHHDEANERIDQTNLKGNRKVKKGQNVKKTGLKSRLGTTKIRQLGDRFAKLKHISKIG